MSRENPPRPSSSSSSPFPRENVHGKGGEKKALAGPVAPFVGESSSAIDPTSKTQKTPTTGYHLDAAIYRRLGIQPPSKDNDNDPQRKKMKETVESAHGAENPRNEDKDEEVTILQGILGYYSKNETYPFSNLIDFHNSLKNSLQTTVSASQLMHRIEGLKEKYDKIEKHDDNQEEVFKLSRMIWGGDGAEKKNVDEQSKNVNVEEVVVGEKQLSLSMYPFLKQFFRSLKGSSCGLGQTTVKEGLRLLGKSKAKELDEECKKLEVEEAGFYLKKLELIQKQTKLIRDTVASSNYSKSHKRRRSGSSSTPK